MIFSNVFFTDFPNTNDTDSVVVSSLRDPAGNSGIWEYGNMGLWDYGIMGLFCNHSRTGQEKKNM
jgi:hypothetical protein